jgi:hypothetical protein
MERAIDTFLTGAPHSSASSDSASTRALRVGPQGTTRRLQALCRRRFLCTQDQVHATKARSHLPASLALTFAESDGIDDARRQWNDYVGTGFEFVVDPSWVIGMCGLAEGAIVVGDPTYAAPLFNQLARWAGQFCTTGITAQGPVSN